MSLRTLMQAGPAKVNDLFARLADTSDGAVKTREKLFEELKAELELHASLEEQHLFPVLRRHAETKALVGDATRDNRELRAKLAELETLPKNDPAFLERLKNLQKAFRQHARDETRELLPAVQRALSDEQVERVTEKIEAGVVEAERARHEEIEAQRAKARQEREKAEQERQAAAEQVQAAELEQRRAQECETAEYQTEQETPASRSDGMEGRTNNVGDAVRRDTTPTLPDAVRPAEIAAAGPKRVVAEITQIIASDVCAAASLPRHAVRTAAEVQAAWTEYMRETALAGAKMSQAVLSQATEQQQKFIAEAIQYWIKHNSRMVQLGLDMTLASMRPLTRGSRNRLHDAQRGP